VVDKKGQLGPAMKKEAIYRYLYKKNPSPEESTLGHVIDYVKSQVDELEKADKRDEAKATRAVVDAAVVLDDVQTALGWKEGIGLGEVMNFPGVLMGDENTLLKIAATRGKPVDGHSPGLRGRELNAYIAAGIHSDHESVSLAEAKAKLARGMYIMIREGSSEKNLAALLSLVTDKTYKRCFFVVDDRSCADLWRDGDIDAVVL
jgi:adenine deaminase